MPMMPLSLIDYTSERLFERKDGNLCEDSEFLVLDCQQTEPHRAREPVLQRFWKFSQHYFICS